MNEQPTEYGKELIEAVARAIDTATVQFDWSRLSEGARAHRRKQARAALLAACAKLKEPTLEMGEAGIASLASDDDRRSASIAGDVWDAMIAQLRTEIAG